jgi:hypothetical protein
MAVQADSTAGFVGEVSTAQTPAVFGHGSRYSVEGPGDLRVTAGGAGDRALTVAAGTAWGDAVLATWDGPTVMNAAAGTRWNTLVNRRDWGAETATLTLLQGGTARALAPGVQLRNPTASTGAGYTYADQPIALVRTTSGETAIQEVVDLRCWAGDGGLLAAAPEALQYLTEPGTQVRIGTTLHTRIISGSGNPAWVADSFAPYQKVTSFGSSVENSGWTIANLGSYLIRDGKRRTMFLEQRRVSGTVQAGSNGSIANLQVFTLVTASDRPIGSVPLTMTYLETAGGGDFAGRGTLAPDGTVYLNSLLPGGRILPHSTESLYSVRYYATWYVA